MDISDNYDENCSLILPLITNILSVLIKGIHLYVMYDCCVYETENNLLSLLLIQ